MLMPLIYKELLTRGRKRITSNRKMDAEREETVNRKNINGR